MDFCEWSVHPHEEGRERGSPHAPATPLGSPPPPIKGSPPLTCLSHLLVKDLSPALEFIPHGLGLARYMFPVAIRQERVVLPMHRWTERRRLLGASNVCVSTDALLICSARTSSRS